MNSKDTDFVFQKFLFWKFWLLKKLVCGDDKVDNSVLELFPITKYFKFRNKKVVVVITSMLVTDVGYCLCWWQV